MVGLLYSAPFTLVGKTLWLRATDAAVALFEDYRHVATHPRGLRPGQRVSVREHLPPEAQAFFGRDRTWCAELAARVGPACRALIEQLLADHILERLRAAQGVLALLKPYGRERLDAACARALAHGSPHYRTVKTILATGADQRCDLPAPTPPAYGRTRFTRAATELFADLATTSIPHLDVAIAGACPLARGVELDALERHVRQGDQLLLFVVPVGERSLAGRRRHETGRRVPVSVELLEPLLRRKRSEFLINFVYDFVNRAASIATQQDNIRRLIGRDIDLDGLEPAEREAALLRAYRAGLKDSTPSGRSVYVPRTAYVSVRHPEKQRTKYHLIYMTSHPKGIVEFMTISEVVDVIQARVHVAAEMDRRSAAKQSQDMFADHAVTVADDPRSTPAEVDGFWRRYLANGARRVDLAAFADILEETDWLPTELQASLLRLIHRREIIDLDAIGKRRPSKPLHFEGNGERLHLQGTPGGHDGGLFSSCE